MKFAIRYCNWWPTENKYIWSYVPSIFTCLYIVTIKSASRLEITILWLSITISEKEKHWNYYPSIEWFLSILAKPQVNERGYDLKCCSVKVQTSSKESDSSNNDTMNYNWKNISFMLVHQKQFSHGNDISNRAPIIDNLNSNISITKEWYWRVA